MLVGGKACEPNPWVGTWHHYCVTYAAEEHPKEKDRYLPGNVTLYVDGRKEGFWKNATVNTSLGSPLYIGADIKGSETLDGAVDECASTTRLWDAWQVEVLHGILSPAADGRAVRRTDAGAKPSAVSLADAHVGADGPRVPGQPRGLLPDDVRQAGRRPDHGVGIPRQSQDEALTTLQPGGGRGSAADRRARRSRGRRGGAQQQQVHQAARQRDEAHLRGPAEDGLPLGADRQVEEQSPDLRVRQKGAQGELFGLRTWNVPGEFALEAVMERSEPLGQSTRQAEHERQHGAGADADAV